jgi:thiamine pyrophosphokinase
MSKALLFANGDPNDGVMVRRTFEHAGDALVIAADGGAHVAEYYGCRVDAVIGDMDSLIPDELAALEKNGAKVLRYPPEKDETDLELALKWAVSQKVDWLRIIGGTGGRFDQMMANVYLLALPELHGVDAALVSLNQEIYLLSPGSHILHGVTGDTVSLIPIGGSVHGVSTEQLKYPLRGETLLVGPARGISNVMLEDAATVTLEDGLLLAVHTVGRA